MDITMTSSHDQLTSQFEDIHAAFTPVESITSFRAQYLIFFPKKKVVLWFIRMESMFLCSRITIDLSKYHHTVSALDTDTMVEVEHILRNPPEKGKYVQLKT